MTQLKVSFFGKLSESIGREVTLDREGLGVTVAELRQALAARYTAAAADLLSPRVRACINDRLGDDADEIMPGDEVAFLPPVSGG